jgi:predicted AlkP superfamily pyrophosphatase or phosphodiesterase
MARKKCLLVGLDGLRADVTWELMEQKRCPHLSSLWGRVAKTHSGAQAGQGYYWKTAPGWASVFAGVDNRVHGIKSNSKKQVRKFWDAKRTTVFDHVSSSAVLAKPFVYSAGRMQVPSLLDRHTFDEAMAVHYEVSNGDQLILQRMRRLMGEDQVPDLFFVHLDVTDQAGHKHGFGFNRHYRQAIKTADRYLGNLLRMVNDRGGKEDWLVLVVSDHGGHNKTHTTCESTENQVPFMCNLDPVDIPKSRPLCHMDVAPTVLHWLRRDVPGHMRHKGLTF